jgi:hypothetical protein
MTPPVSAWGSSEDSWLSPPPKDDDPLSPPASPSWEDSPSRPLVAVSDWESCSTSVCSKASAVS